MKGFIEAMKALPKKDLVLYGIIAIFVIALVVV